jgi:hypothetical protein
MPEQELHGPEILRPPIDQRRFGAAQRMGTVRCRIKPDLADPSVHDPGVLTGRKMRGRSQATGKQEVVRSSPCLADPRRDGLPSLLSDLELHGTPCLLLHDNCPCCHTVAAGHVLYPKLHQVAGAEFAVDREIEQGEFSRALGQLKTYPDGPDLLEAQRRLCPTSLPLFRGSRCLRSLHSD